MSAVASPDSGSRLGGLGGRAQPLQTHAGHTADWSRELKTGAGMYSDAPSRLVLRLQTGLRDRYELDAFLGQGGFASVYKVTNLRLHRAEAIKVLQEEHGEDESFALRFSHEARVAASLDHPNIVKVYDFGDVDGTYWYSMQLIEGSTLRAEFRRRGVYDEQTAAQLVIPILDALHYCHQKSVIHRDIKPENIILDYRGRPHLMDFGIAKSAEALHCTRTGFVMGTPAYMAPEQFAGEEIDGRTDLYALGVMLYFMVSGHFPFPSSDSVQTMIDRVTREPDPLSARLPAIDSEFASIVMKALERQKERRYPSAAAMEESLEAFLAGHDRTTNNSETILRSSPRDPTILSEVEEKSAETGSNSAAPLTKAAEVRQKKVRGLRLLGWLAASLAAGAATALLVRPPGRTEGSAPLAAAVSAQPTQDDAVRVVERGDPGATRIEPDRNSPISDAVPVDPAVTARVETSPTLPAESLASPAAVSGSGDTQKALPDRAQRRAATPPIPIGEEESVLPVGLSADCSGTVVNVVLTIGEDGRARDAKIKGGAARQCAEAALAIARGYRYRPALDDGGAPVEVTVLVAIVLPDSSPSHSGQ